jgi:hypothetical protein
MIESEIETVTVTETVDRNKENTKAATAAKKTAALKTASTVPPKSDTALFVSAGKEIRQFDITVAGQRIDAFWDEKREHLCWRVPNALADRFAMHEFVERGRILRAEG